jgi:hypothetical protein
VHSKGGLSNSHSSLDKTQGSHNSGPSRLGQQQQPGAQVNDSGPFKPPAGTKIEEKVLAPLQEGASFEVSPHGVHVATVSTDGSRAVVFYDGVVGPKFDQILALPTGRNARIAFSPDGNRYAYCARLGRQLGAFAEKRTDDFRQSIGGSYVDKEFLVLDYLTNVCASCSQPAAGCPAGLASFQRPLRVS